MFSLNSNRYVFKIIQFNKQMDKATIKERAKVFFKDPHNWILIGLLVFALIFRIYYFSVTVDQPLWWDESEYLLKAKSIAFGTPDTGWGWFRPVLFPLFIALFLKVGLGIVGIKLLWILLSLAGVLLMYSVGKELFNKKAGLIAAAIYSVFYLDIFYMSRLLVDMPAIVVSLLVIYLTIKRKNKYFAWLIFPVLIIGTLFRFTVIITLLLVLLYLFYTTGFKFFKEKPLWISVLIGIIAYLPYGIWSWIKFGGPFTALLRASIGADREIARWDVLSQYLSYFPNYIYTTLLIVFFLGLAAAVFSLVIAPDLIKKNKGLQSKLFLLSWIIIPFLIFGLLINHFEDRYLFIIFPAVFLIIASGLLTIGSFIKRFNKWIALAVVILILVFGMVPLVKYSDNIVKSKVNSYDGLRKAGLWINEHSQEGDIVFSSGHPQNTAYSGRETFRFPASEKEFEERIEELKPRYFILSIWERSPPWAYELPNKMNSTMRIANAFFLDKEQTKPDTVIYEFVY